MPLHLVFGDFELDESRYELRRRGAPVAVQPRVLDLILHLARHRERVVGKDELLDAIWKGTAVTEASLSQALSVARRALDDTSEAQRVIRTVRSKGFRFVAPVRDAASGVSARAAARAPAEARAQVAEAASTAMETALEDAARTRTALEALHLFAALHCEAPADGGAAWSLADVDEVHIGRASGKRTDRRAGPPLRVLEIAFPGRLLSRRHARLVRARDDWF